MRLPQVFQTLRPDGIASNRIHPLAANAEDPILALVPEARRDT